MPGNGNAAMSQIRLLFVLAMTVTMVIGLAACSRDANEPESSLTPTPAIAETEDVTTRIVSPSQEEPDRSARRDDGSLGVVFRVTVPPGTPPESTILMTGDRPALGSGVVMKPLDTDPLIYEGEVVFGHDGTLNYRFELNGGEAVSGPKRVETEFDGQVVNDLIESWSVDQ